MNILIAYASKTGSTKKCAIKLKEYINFDSTLIDLNQNHPNPKGYDVIVLGSSVRMGKIQKNVSNYIKKYSNILHKKPVFIFASCISKDNSMITKNLNPSLLSHASLVESFGGELDLSKQKGVDKIIAKFALKFMSDPNISLDISEKKIKSFADKINNLN